MVWLGREVPLWAERVTWKEHRHQREPVPSETDAVPAGTPAPVSVTSRQPQSLSHFTDETTEAQDVSVTCPGARDE